MQYTYWLISQEVKTTSQWKLVSYQEYNLRNIFLEKSYTKCVGETISRSFSKKIKIEHISGSIFWSFIYFVFTVCQVKDYQKWLKLSCRPFVFTSYKAFLKNKKKSGTSPPASFSAWFFRKIICLVIFYYLTGFQCLPLLCEILGNMCVVIVDLVVTS